MEQYNYKIVTNQNITAFEQEVNDLGTDGYRVAHYYRFTPPPEAPLVEPMNIAIMELAITKVREEDVLDSSKPLPTIA